MFVVLLILVFAVFWFVQEGRTPKPDGGVKESIDPVTQADTLEVHYIDVGQGDATLIKCGEHAMLIDAGDYTKGSAVWAYLLKQNVDKLDYVIGTHLDADHIGGMDVVITKFDCGVILVPEYEKDTKSSEELFDAIEAKNYHNTLPKVRDTYQLGDAIFTILAPEKEFYEKENNYSIGIRLVYGQNSFLFVGDAQEESEEEMLRSGLELKADVLKVGHHGSSSSTSEGFLHTAAPTYAVISCGKENDYGHPHAVVLNLLRREGVRVFRTDEQGSIVAYSDGTDITWNCAPSESWKAGEMVSN
ncbi:MAG: MBL fold metallo-hydrolase [Lachnospiraceae bacterium]|nr:MBL fold metallo-hydrolase [Lachnospiraceae bacterium]